MPVYFTLQEALAASQTAHKDYNPRMKGGREGKAIFVQKPEIKPIVVQEPVEPAPIVIEDQPGEDPTKDLQDKINKVLAERTEIDQKLKTKEPTVEVYKEPPSLIRSLAVVKVVNRKDVQTIRGGQAVTKTKAAEGVNRFTRGGAKWASEKPGVVSGVVAGTENMIAHPIATAQNIIKEPIQNRNIAFANKIEEIVKQKIFPENHELPMKLPEDFIQIILEAGLERRNKHGILRRGFNFVKDLNPMVSVAAIAYETQQKRALEFLNEFLANPDTDRPEFAAFKPKFEQIKKDSLEYAGNLAQGFALTLTNGKEVIPGQTALGNKRILLEGEKRQEVDPVKNAELENRIKTEVLEKFFKPTHPNPPTPEEELQMIKEINEIYKEQGLITQEDLDSGEFANNIVLELQDMLKDKDFFSQPQNWEKVHFVNYTGSSLGEALGGREQFTLNEEIALKAAHSKSKIGKGEGVFKSAILGATNSTIYLGGYIASWGMSAANFLPRSGIAKAVPLLGPAASGLYAANAEATDINIGGYHKESRVTGQQRDVSKSKALGKNTSETDYVRNQLEKQATVTPVPASELSNSILNLALEDPNNWQSETKKLNETQVLELFTNIAHAQARLKATHQSGSKELEFTTQNWVSYKEGTEQAELTKLKTSCLQAYSRLMNLQDQPNLFNQVPFYDSSHPESLDSALETMTNMIAYGLKQGLPLQILDGSPINTTKSKKFYKQIFLASGVSEEQFADGEKFIALLKNSNSVFAGKKMGEWLDEAESFKMRMKNLKQIKRQRAVTAGATGAISSAFFSTAKYAGEQAWQHVVTDHQPQPVAPAGPDQASAPAPEITKTIDLPNIFKDSAGSTKAPMMIWDDATGKIQRVDIPMASGFHFKGDNQNNMDLYGPNGIKYEDVFVFDPKHGAFVPNKDFILDITHPEIKVDLNKHIDFVTNQKVVPVEGTPVELTGGANIVAYLKEHFPKAMSEIAHRDVYKDQSPQTLTTFVDSDGKVHITQGGYSAPNITGGSPQSLSSGLENGSGALWFTFGKNADRTLTQDSTPLSFEGIKVPLTWHEKGNGGYGEFIFDPRHPNPNIPQEVLLAKLIDQQALDKFANIGPDNWLDEKELGELWMGIRGYEGGFISQTPDGPKMHDFRMEFVGNNNPLKISPPDTTTTTTTNMIPPTPVEIKIPVETPPVAAPEPIQTPSVSDVKFTPIPGKFNLPQVEVTKGEENVPVSSTRLPQSIINSAEFKKEKQPDGYTNQEALAFLRTIPTVATGHNQLDIDNFILKSVFTTSQQEFLNRPTTHEFINTNVMRPLEVNHKNIADKIRDNIHEQLTNDNIRDLRRTVSNQARASGLTDREAQTVSDFLIHRTYLDNIRFALHEKQQLDEELQLLNESLEAVRAANATPIPPRNPPNPSPAIEGAEKIKLVDDFTSKLVHDFHDLLSEKLPSEQRVELFANLENKINQFIFEVYLDENQVETINSIPNEINIQIEREIKADENIFSKMQESKEFDPQDLLRLRLILNRFLNKKEAEAYYSGFTTSVYITSQVREKMEVEDDFGKEEQKNENGIELLDKDEAKYILKIDEADLEISTSFADLSKQNETAAEQFIQRLDEMYDKAKQKPKYERGFLLLENGFAINPQTSWYDYLKVSDIAMGRYKLPFIFLNTGGHANLVLKIDHDEKAKKWHIIIYDPKSGGENELDQKGHTLSSSPIKIIELDDTDSDIEVKSKETSSPIWRLLSNSVSAGNNQLFFPTSKDTVIGATLSHEQNMAWFNFVANGGYDLTLLGDADLTDEQVHAKIQAFQTKDSTKCVVYSLWAAIIRTAAKYSPDDCPEVYRGFFKDGGLEQFKKDFDIDDILTRDRLTLKKDVDHPEWLFDDEPQYKNPNNLEVGKFEGLEVFKLFGELKKSGEDFELKEELDLAIHQFENDFLPKILGVKYEDFGPDTGHVTFNTELKKAVIDYFAYPKQQAEYLAQIQEALDKLKREATNVTLNNINAKDIVGAHIKLFSPPDR